MWLNGTTSSIRLHFCNQNGECCTTFTFQSGSYNGETYFSLHFADLCIGLELAKDVASQRVELEHEGPERIELKTVSVFFAQETSIFACYEAGEATIVLPGGANRRVVLTCNEYWLFKRDIGPAPVA